MSLLDKLNDDLKAAMRGGDQARKLTLRAVKTAVRQEEVSGDKARTLTDEEILGVIAKQAKQRRDAIEEFTKGDRPDLVKEEEITLVVQVNGKVRTAHPRADRRASQRGHRRCGRDQSPTDGSGDASLDGSSARSG